MLSTNSKIFEANVVDVSKSSRNDFKARSCLFVPIKHWLGKIFYVRKRPQSKNTSLSAQSGKMSVYLCINLERFDRPENKLIPQTPMMS